MAWNKLDYLLWNGTMPALTLCYHNRFDEAKAQRLIKSLWNIETNDDEYSYFLDFIRMVTNTTIASFGMFKRFAGDKRMEFVDLFLIARDVHPDMNSKVSSFDPNFNPDIVEVMTDRGICYSINSILSARALQTRYA